MTKKELYKIVKGETTIYRIAKEQKKRWHKVAFEFIKVAKSELKRLIK